MNQQYQVIRINGEIAFCDGENESDCFELQCDASGQNCQKIYKNTTLQIGSCIYPSRMFATLSDFKDNTALWTFSDYQETNNLPAITPECREQRLPFNLKTVVEQGESVQFQKAATDYPKLIDGLSELAPDAIISERNETFLLNNQGKPFRWGELQLGSLVWNMQENNSEIEYIEVFTEDKPKLMTIDGIECYFDKDISLVMKRKPDTPNNSQFSNFELAICTMQIPDLSIEGQKITDAHSFAWTGDEEDLYDHFYGKVTLANRYTATNLLGFNFDLKYNVIKLGLVFQPENAQGELLTPDQTFKVGECEYPALMLVFLSDFHNGVAEWTFEDVQDDSYPNMLKISDACKKQRLPYKITLNE